LLVFAAIMLVVAVLATVAPGMRALPTDLSSSRVDLAT